MRKTLISVVTLLSLIIGSALVAGPASSTPAYVPTFATLSSTTAGTLGTATVTMTGPSSGPFISLFAGSDYVPPAPSVVDAVAVDGSTPLTISFSTPVTNPALYFLALPTYPASTTLDLASTGGTCKWSILSGLTGLTLTGIALSAPTEAAASGIVLCTGTVSSISLTPSSATSSPAANYTIALAALFDPTPPPAPTTTTTPAVEPVVPAFTG